MINNTQQSEIVHGWKFLNGVGATEGRDLPGYPHKKGQQPAMHYFLPRPNQKWGEWNTHPTSAKPDGQDCGEGKLHIMNMPSASYAPPGWWIWFAEGRTVLGQSSEKTAVAEVRLRRVRPEVFWRIIRLGWCAGASLYGANLRNVFGYTPATADAKE